MFRLLNHSTRSGSSIPNHTLARDRPPVSLEEVQEIEPPLHDQDSYLHADEVSDNEDDDDETEFQYTPQSASTFANAFLRRANIDSLRMSSKPLDKIQVEDDNEEEEEFTYPGSSSPLTEPTPLMVAQAPEPSPPVVRPSIQTPTVAQLEAIFAAASAGNLASLRDIFSKAQNEQAIEPFVLANEATSRTGLNSLHSAASRGHLDVVRWRTSLKRSIYNIQESDCMTS